MLAFTVFTYEAILTPQFPNLETQNAISDAIRRQAILLFAASQNRAEDQEFVRVGEVFLIHRFRDYFDIFTREEAELLDSWFFRTTTLVRTVVKTACEMSRELGAFESICPSLHRHFNDMAEIVPIQVNSLAASCEASQNNSNCNGCLCNCL
jgi:hypothetical protein